ncbi:MAG: helix-turn-helix domain-containing protein, partial [Sulfuricurvum sp.]|nr:helix-turn-helix domain-containing protein [Sulfuricurvum sp.]
RQPSYYAIITADVRYDKNLTPNEKLLYAELSSLINMNGECRAENSYFASLYGVHLKTISVWINNLIKHGYLSSKIEYLGNSKKVDCRILTLSNVAPLHANTETPLHANTETPLHANTETPLHANTEVYINTPTECNKECPKSSSDDTSSEFDLHISQRLFEYLKAIHSSIKTPDFKKWAKHVRDMRVIDKRTEKQIEAMLTYIFEGTNFYQELFWRSNIKSTDKLRAQYDTVALQVTNSYNRYIQPKRRTA